MSTVTIIAKREYFKVIRKKSFWAVMLLLPIFYIIVAVVSGESQKSVQKSIMEQATKAKHILVVDEANIIDDALIKPPLERSSSPADATALVQKGEADAAFLYPADLTRGRSIAIVVLDTGVLARSRFDALAQNLIRQSILGEVKNAEKIALFNATLKIEKTVYKNGQPVVQGIEGFLVPILAVVAYFLLVMLSSSYMLMSVSEEKENRMIETVLSLVKPRQLIWGKLLGLVGLAVTQIIVLALFVVVAYSVSSSIFPIHINWSLVHVTFTQILLTVIFIFSGFGLMASLMVGIGAAMPTYRDAQQASPLFIIVSILPVYLAMALVAEPTGTLARTLSYIPFMSPLVLTYRASAGALPPLEAVIGVLVSAIYLVGGVVLAFKLFEIGSIETAKRISFRSMFQKK